VYLFTVDLDRLLLEIEVAGPRCTVCDPDTDRAAAGGGDSPTESFEVAWAGPPRGDAFAGLDLLDTRRPHLAAERLTGSAPPGAAQPSGGAGPVAAKFGDEAWAVIVEAWSPGRCRAFAATADALDAIRARIRAGIATGVRITLRWDGAPPIVAALTGELVARAAPAHFRTPLLGLAQLLRAAAALLCAGTGNAGSCATASDDLPAGIELSDGDGWIGLPAAYEHGKAHLVPELPRRIPGVPGRIRSSWLFHDCPADGGFVWRRGTCNIVYGDGEDTFTGDVDVIAPGTEASLMIEQVPTPSGGVALVGWATYRTVDGDSADVRIVLAQEGFEDAELDDLWRLNALTH
jgi:hypothetical protein